MYLAVLHGVIDVYDSQAMVSVTQNLVNHGTLRTTGAGWILGPVSTPWAPYGLGLSLLAVPFYALSKLFGHPAVLESLVSPFATSISVVLIYRIARVLDWRPSQGVLAAVSYGIFSMAIWYSTELLERTERHGLHPDHRPRHAAVEAGSARAPLWIGTRRGRCAPASNRCCGDGLDRPLGDPLVCALDGVAHSAFGRLIFGPMALSFAVLGWYDELRFHRLFEGSYGPGGGFSTPLWHGLDGLLFSPGRSLFLYNPLTILGVVGLILLLVGPGVARDRPLGVLMAILIVTRIVFYAKWGVWDGGWTWGPRFLLPVVALLSLALPTVLRCDGPPPGYGCRRTSSSRAPRRPRSSGELSGTTGPLRRVADGIEQLGHASCLRDPRPPDVRPARSSPRFSTEREPHSRRCSPPPTRGCPITTRSCGQRGTRQSASSFSLLARRASRWLSSAAARSRE